MELAGFIPLFFLHQTFLVEYIVRNVPFKIFDHAELDDVLSPTQQRLALLAEIKQMQLFVILCIPLCNILQGFNTGVIPNPRLFKVDDDVFVVILEIK